MPSVLAALANPAGEYLALGPGELSFGIGRRHGVVGGVNPREDLAFLRRDRIDGPVTASITGGSSIRIQAQLIFVRDIRTVADEALVRQDRQHLAGEVDATRIVIIIVGGGGACRAEQAEQHESDSKSDGKRQLGDKRQPGGDVQRPSEAL